MATLATQNIGTGGLGATYSPVTASDKVVPGDGTFLHVKNGSASSVTVELVTPQTVDGLAVADRQVSVPASGDRFIAVPDMYADRTDSGLATVNFLATTSVTVAVLRA
ncbi:hypothetical protein [Pseudonocardia parietis]|uniref:Uncharacterized protein n=1 Tax=Pseudonocardia parietis TaxID=570936 RepID=A0ABS4W232_9PSEU|nr:hypothetical protein [Pseudonocardia parietis]MBP2370225.1 hypothetical protein [Pseudonocardia parietis]